MYEFYLWTGQTGKETFDEKDVSTIAQMSLEKVMEMVKAEMAKAAGDKKGPPQASRQSGLLRILSLFINILTDIFLYYEMADTCNRLIKYTGIGVLTV